ncbi:MAG: type I glutamate--ammonia ligase [Candidatus Roizmanbacteria bacterium]
MISSKKAFELIKSGEIVFVDLKFTDLRGTWQHFTISARDFTEPSCVRGFGFDGSSIKGFQSIFESDMLLKPDLETIFIDPFFEKTLSVICDVYDPASETDFEKCPRVTAKKAETYLKKTKLGDLSYWGPEVEFFVFDRMEYDLTPYSSYINLGSQEADTSDVEGDGYKIMTKTGYFPVPPFDKLQTFRSEVVMVLESIGIEIEVHHHEVASAGQCEIDMKYDTLVKMADKVMMYKYVVRNVAKKYGMTASFLPKPIFGDNGSGMHTHQSIFKGGKNIFFDPKGYGELSQEALAYIAGLLSHLKALLGITNPTLNSYRRLVPHFEAPTSVAFSKRNRSAAIRTPMYFKNEEKSKRIELRCPDPTCNPYLSFSAQLVLGVEGLKSKLDPTTMGFGPFDENIWEKSDVQQTPGSLAETLDALKKCDVFIKSGVFAQSLMDSYLDVKKEEMCTALMYPTPSDYHFYSDI